MEFKESYESLSVAIKELQKLGYSIDFNLVDDKLASKKENKTWEPKDLNVVKHYRFEGKSDPGDNTILYVIETTDGHKGLLLDVFGADSNAISPEMIEKLRIDYTS